MNDDAPRDGQALEDFLGFLQYLANLQIDPRLRAKLDPEGLVQETLLRAHKAHDQFRGTERRQKKAWLRTIFLRVLANELRRLKAESPLDQAVEDSSARVEVFIAAEQSTPSEQAQRNEAALQLEEALAGLPERQREAVVLKHIHGWSLAAIRAHLGVSTAAVAGLLNRGLKELRDVLPRPE
jgi:RNA polymerase sigma-70 factor, ECF subfamily